MNEPKFTELVNLYFDREISSEELELLRVALAECPTHKCEFEARYRLHQAMQMAVAPEVLEAEQVRANAARRATRASRLTLWVLGSGVAACVTFGVVILRPVLREFSNLAAAEEQAEMARSDMSRFAATRGTSELRRGSLASELRLMGLTPEMAPAERQLSGVDVEAQRQREARRLREIDSINQYKAFSAMPEPQLFESLEPRPVRAAETHRWPAGFRTSLANY